jgi:hypothetical protein
MGPAKWCSERTLDSSSYIIAQLVRHAQRFSGGGSYLHCCLQVRGSERNSLMTTVEAYFRIAGYPPETARRPRIAFETPTYRYGCSTFLDTARPISLRFGSLQVNNRRDELDAGALSLVV